MGTKLLWTGLFFIVGATPALKVIGLSASEVLIVVGAVLMLLGCLALWADK